MIPFTIGGLGIEKMVETSIDWIDNHKFACDRVLIEG